VKKKEQHVEKSFGLLAGLKLKAAIRNFFVLKMILKYFFEQVHNQPVFKTV